MAEKAFSIKTGGDSGMGTDSPDGVAHRQIVGASASVLFTCTIKSRRWREEMDEVNKGCSEFCVTVGIVTRTAGIQIHSWLKAPAVNFSRTSGRLGLYVGLIGSNNLHQLLLAQSTINGMSSKAMDLAVCANPSLPHGCEWVKVSSGTGSPG